MISDDQAVAELPFSEKEREAVRNNGKLVHGRVCISIEDDVVRMENFKGLGTAQFIYVLRICEEVFLLRGRFFMLALNGERASPMTAEQRRIGAQWSRKCPSSGTAIVSSAHSLVSTMVMLLIRAINMLIPRPIPLAFFQTEGEARAWLATLAKHLPRP